MRADFQLCAGTQNKEYGISQCCSKRAALIGPVHRDLPHPGSMANAQEVLSTVAGGLKKLVKSTGAQQRAAAGRMHVLREQMGYGFRPSSIHTSITLPEALCLPLPALYEILRRLRAHLRLRER